MITYIFLFLFSFSGNSTVYNVVPQPSMEVCDHNGYVMIHSNSNRIMVGSPYNEYVCIDMSKPLPDNFKWNYIW